MELCSACGVVAPSHATACGCCGAVLEQRFPIEEEVEPYWTAVECSFECRACKRRVPLDGLYLGGVIQCGACGVAQACDPATWQMPLALAHTIGDLAGPDAMGRYRTRREIGDLNAYRVIGLESAFGQSQWSGEPQHRAQGGTRPSTVLAL